MNTAGVDAQVSDAEEDYKRQLNALQAQQAGSGAFGSRADLQDLGALDAQQRTIAQIRGAGYDRAAQLMEADIGRVQDAGMQTQRVGTEASLRNQAADLEAQGMGLDAQARFREQQIRNARQLADIGGLEQGATFGAGRELQAMGAQQEAAQRRQQAYDYEQWLRDQEGGGRELALAQSFLPGGIEQEFEREPSRLGEIGGGLLGAAGVGMGLYDRFKGRGGAITEEEEEEEEVPFSSTLLSGLNSIPVPAPRRLPQPTRWAPPSFWPGEE
mgnify:FL=1